MPSWWKTTPYSRSSISSSPPPNNSNLSTTPPTKNRSSFFRSRKPNTKLADIDVADIESTGSLSSRSPPGLAKPVLLPLPLPEGVEAQLDGLGLGGSAPAVCANCSAGRRLPSPTGDKCRGEGGEGNGIGNGNGFVVEALPLAERIGERLSSSPIVIASRLTQYPPNRRPEHSDMQFSCSSFSQSKRVFQDPNSTGSLDYNLNIPARSASTGGISSPVCTPLHSPLLSPPKATNIDLSTSSFATSVHRVWSAPEIPSTSRTKTFSSQTSPMIASSPDQSPLYSPRAKSPILRSRDSSAPASPLHSKFLSESTTVSHESSGSVAVHPLPLPPGASTVSQSGFSYQATTKVESTPMTNQWQKGRLIGSGTFGNVYEATNRHTGALCAMKEVNIIPDDAKSAECFKQLEQEIKFLSQFKHPNIVQYYGSETIDDRFYIYLEYIHPGSMNKYVRQHCGAMTESMVRNFTRHILRGLAYLHSKKIMHRDIKGANLLVDVSGVVKLADFGMAKHLSGAASALSLRGSPYWMAPEVMQATMNKDGGYDLAVDIWSLGCTIIEMFTGKHPWSDLEGAAAMFKVLHKSPPIPESLSNEGKDFLQCCFRRNPADRPTSNMLLEHPFIRHSQHYNTHGSLHAFSATKIIDNSIDPSAGKSKSDSCLKGNHPSSGESNHSHTETFESTSFRVLTRSTPDTSTNVADIVQTSAGNFRPYALPKPFEKETVRLV